MNRLVTLILSAAFGLLALPARAGSKPGEVPSVSFHVETDSNDNPKLIFPLDIDGKRHYFRRLPEVSAKDVQAFAPFPSSDGSTYGVLFGLKPGGANRLASVTTERQGQNQFMLAMVNGRPVDVVLIDKAVVDRVIVIWKGITAAEIEQYDKLAPRIGAPDKKKKK